MPKKRRIPTPISQHWNHFRTGLLPLIAFLACIWATMMLWERRATQGTIFAEAEAKEVDVASSADGRLLSLEAVANRPDWKVWDEVGKGEIIAVLDDSLLKAEIEVVHGATDKLIAELETTKARAEFDVRAISQRFDQNKFNRAFEASRFKIQKREVEVAIVDDKMAGAVLLRDLKILEKAGLAAAERDRVRIRQQLEQLRARIYKNEELLGEIDAQLALTNNFVKEYAEEMNLPQLEELDEHIQKVVDAQDAQIDLLNLRIENMTVRAPIAGVIKEIHKLPGEAIVEGEPIVTIGTDSAQYIVGYWRENHAIRPERGLPVNVRLTQPGGQEFECTIHDVGAQYEPVPTHQLRDYSRPEYGVPVRIEIPEPLKASVKPGELVHVIYRGGRPQRTSNR
ncbi:MAG: HlyD family efflux transporter periplasmic adaptor subunit [Planctomycetales bacterium]|nr:HlyD family efflux transporter periplasmic adaptor subunit [Planctomycetales bacterium]